MSELGDRLRETAKTADQHPEWTGVCVAAASGDQIIYFCELDEADPNLLLEILARGMLIAIKDRQTGEPNANL